MYPAFGSVSWEPPGESRFFGNTAQDVCISLTVKNTGKSIWSEIDFDLNVSHFIFSAVGLDVGLELGHASASNHYSRTLSLEVKLNNLVTLAHLWQGLLSVAWQEHPSESSEGVCLI